ncbi:MAG: anaerobic ribonucleoside-triphosphate reductase activating protein [Oscillospiraceae bacterium]|jgi:anaerobic ribonucleoside-triphosphate reductase activating protein|nr:anaerobic ribonucleoside-triphosphate reductase activating protein [Oscillospiraceae bacterium]
MNYAELKQHDVANGPGVRVSLYVSGCEHACPGCFNPEAWQFGFGTPYTPEVEQQVLRALAPDYIRGLSLLGGEPLHPRNRAAVQRLVHLARTAFPKKDIWCYTGYVFKKELQNDSDPVLQSLLREIDILVDGRFIEARKNLNLQFRGSENQQVIRMAETLRSGKIVRWEPPL